MRVHPGPEKGSSSVHTDRQRRSAQALPKDAVEHPYWQQVENSVRRNAPQLTDAEIDAYMKQMLMNEEACIGVVAALVLTMGVQLCMTPRSSFLSGVSEAQIYAFIALSSGTVALAAFGLTYASLLYGVANKCPPHLCTRLWWQIERAIPWQANPAFVLPLSSLFLISATVLGISLTQGSGYVWVSAAFVGFAAVCMVYAGVACGFAWHQVSGVHT